jgi:hypothetical protein
LEGDHFGGREEDVREKDGGERQQIEELMMVIRGLDRSVIKCCIEDTDFKGVVCCKYSSVGLSTVAFGLIMEYGVNIIVSIFVCLLWVNY